MTSSGMRYPGSLTPPSPMPVDAALFQPLLDDAQFRRVLDAVRVGTPVSVAGLVESSKALVLHLLHGLTGRPVLLVVPVEELLEEYARDLAAFARLFEGAAARSAEGTPGVRAGAARVLRFPALGADPYQGMPPHFRTSADRVTS